MKGHGNDPGPLTVLDHLDRSGVRTAVLHGRDELRQPMTSDVDIVVHHDDLARALDALHTVDGFRLVQRFEYRPFCYGVVLASHTVTSLPVSAVIVDVLANYTCRGRQFFTDQQLLASRVDDRGVWVVAHDVELPYLVVKKFFEKPVVPESQRKRMETLARELGERAPIACSSVLGPALGGRVAALLQRGKWDELETRRAEIRRQLRRQAAPRHLLVTIRAWGSELARVWRRWDRPTGLAVAIVGATDDIAAMGARLQNAMPGVFRRWRVVDARTAFASLRTWIATVRSTLVLVPRAVGDEASPHRVRRAHLVLLIGHGIEATAGRARVVRLSSDPPYDQVAKEAVAAILEFLALRVEVRSW